MRTLFEIAHPSCKISLFTVGQKYIAKFEQGPLAFELKFEHLDIDESTLRSKLAATSEASGSFDVDAVFKTLFAMRETLS